MSLLVDNETGPKLLPWPVSAHKSKLNFVKCLIIAETKFCGVFIIDNLTWDNDIKNDCNEVTRVNKVSN